MKCFQENSSEPILNQILSWVVGWSLKIENPKAKKLFRPIWNLQDWLYGEE